MQGFTDTMAEIAPDVEIIEYATAFSREDGLKDMADILTANPEIDAVYSLDDETSIGALQALSLIHIFRDAALMQAYAADHLHGIGPEPYGAVGGLAAGGEGVGQNIVQRFAEMCIRDRGRGAALLQFLRRLYPSGTNFGII